MDSEGHVRTGNDPTKAVLSESGLNSKHLCDYVINVATGCRHGCKFCYVPATPNIRTRPGMLKETVDVFDPQREWGQYVLYRDDLPGRLDGLLKRKRTWRSTKFGQGIVGISFGTDCYMDGRAGRITRETVRVLADHKRFVRILTRNPVLALQDADVFKDAGEYVTVGSSIPSLDPDEVHAIEPRTPSPQHRLRGLEEFAEMGISTFVSMSPTYPSMDRNDLRCLLSEIASVNPDVVFHEPINPRGGNLEMTVVAARQADQTSLANRLDALRDRSTWLRYSIDHFIAVQDIAAEFGIDIHLWPDKLHLNLANGETERWLREWKTRQSLESFAGRIPPESPLPSLPEG